ncbi:hypothetical protein KEJ17_06080, partial [Candidatus Bathyarchaeota archaeon]|nr:hypothetical protein [Candidatus Bathyarchaeota archaeon]
LNAILFSAIVRHYVFQYMNITSTDYIAESRALKEFLEAREFYIHEEDEMKEIRIEETLSMKTVMLATAPSSRTSFISHLSTRNISLYMRMVYMVKISFSRIISIKGVYDKWRSLR